MFCIKCGAQIPDYSTFCSACGTAIPGTGKAERSGDSYFGKVMGYIAGLFKTPSKNVQKLTSEKSPVYLFIEICKLILAVGACMMVGLPVSLELGGAEPIGEAVMGSLLGSVGFQALFAGLACCAGMGLRFLMTWVCSAKICRLNVPAVVLLNIGAVSTLPILGVLVTFLFLGFIWLPLVLILLLTAAVLSAVIFADYTRTAGIFGDEPLWKNALVICTSFIGSAFFMLLPLAIAY